MKPELIKGGSHSDNRGSIIFNNDFDTTDIKRIYMVENESTNLKVHTYYMYMYMYESER